MCPITNLHYFTTFPLHSPLLLDTSTLPIFSPPSIPLFSLYTLHCSPCISPVFPLHPTLSTPSISPFSLYTLHSPLPQSLPFSLHPTLSTPSISPFLSAPYTLHSLNLSLSLYTLHSPLPQSLPFSLHPTLSTPSISLYTLHSPLPQSLSTPYTLHSLNLSPCPLHAPSISPLHLHTLHSFHLSSSPSTLSSSPLATVPSCQGQDLRLVGGARATEGTIQVCLHQEWASLCDSAWLDTYAAVACNQLGYSQGEEGVNICTTPSLTPSPAYFALFYGPHFHFHIKSLLCVLGLDFAWKALTV